MKQFEAKTLEEAYELASSEYKCSITQLKVTIIQQPSNGFLGIFGKKNAIIGAVMEKSPRSDKKYSSKRRFKKSNIKIEDVSSKIADSEKREKSVKKEIKHDFTKDPKIESKEKIFDNFYDAKDMQTHHAKVVIKKDKQQIIDEVKTKVNELFNLACYELDPINVSFYDEETLYLEFNGQDAALLIGKEGYRYKALSYILFNWINEKYNLMLRLEVAEFLKNQEEAIYKYLEPVISTIHETGSYKTKPLDGILVHIALKRLREEFPDKYVAVKTNSRGDRYILVNEYRSSQS